MKRKKQYLVTAIAIVALTCAIGIGQALAMSNNGEQMGILTAAAGTSLGMQNNQDLAPSFSNQYIPGSTINVTAPAPYAMNSGVKKALPVVTISKATKNDQVQLSTISDNTSATTTSPNTALTMALKSTTLSEPKAVATDIVHGSSDLDAMRAATENVDPTNLGVPLCVANIAGFSVLNFASANDATAPGLGLGAQISASNASGLQLDNLSGGQAAYSRTLIRA